LVEDDEVFIALGDTICEYDIKSVLSSPYSMLGVKKVDDPRDFGVAEIDDDGIITKVVEKPFIPKSNMALVGLYKIKDSKLLFNCLSNIITNGIKSHNEFNLTDALECMITGGAVFKSFKVENWFDCGRKESLLHSNSVLLQKFGGTIAEPNNFENTIFIPPVSIAEGCDIKNSIIGPHVAMGENTIVHSSIIKASIIGSYSKLYDVMLDDSLIGNDTEVIGETRSLNIGDNTEIDLG
jgi:glucose-1-phosphate thymidylyltransferase